MSTTGVQGYRDGMQFTCSPVALLQGYKIAGRLYDTATLLTFESLVEINSTLPAADP